MTWKGGPAIRRGLPGLMVGVEVVAEGFDVGVTNAIFLGSSAGLEAAAALPLVPEVEEVPLVGCPGISVILQAVLEGASKMNPNGRGLAPLGTNIGLVGV